LAELKAKTATRPHARERADNRTTARLCAQGEREEPWSRPAPFASAHVMAVFAFSSANPSSRQRHFRAPLSRSFASLASATRSPFAPIFPTETSADVLHVLARRCSLAGRWSELGIGMPDHFHTHGATIRRCQRRATHQPGSSWRALALALDRPTGKGRVSSSGIISSQSALIPRRGTINSVTICKASGPSPPSSDTKSSPSRRIANHAAADERLITTRPPTIVSPRVRALVEAWKKEHTDPRETG